MDCVLVVDDDEATRILWRINLAADGFDVHEVATVAEAAVAAADLQPVAIVLDLVLVGDDGWSLLEQLRGNPDTAGIPVLVCSARAGARDSGQALAAGAASYLAKPFDPEAGVARVRRLIADRPRRRG